MDQIEFGKICRELNAQYKQLFNYVPTPADFDCTRETYIEALTRAVHDKCLLDMLLPRIGVPEDSKYRY